MYLSVLTQSKFLNGNPAVGTGLARKLAGEQPSVHCRGQLFVNLLLLLLLMVEIVHDPICICIYICMS